MFFIGILGISQKEKCIADEKIICSHCGQYGRLQFFESYQFFHLFFIPLIKWDRNIIVHSTCCDNYYTAPEALAETIKKGQATDINQNDLIPLLENDVKVCQNCGYVDKKALNYCPNCGKQH